MKKKTTTILALLLSVLLYSQDEKANVIDRSNKGKMYILWGWNRGYYSDSDIHFKGEDFDFTLKDVEGVDKITPFSYHNYFKITRITIPQTNFRLGYFFHDNYTLSIGVDHMKYVMPNYNTVQIYGSINAGSSYDGIYNGEDLLVTEEFLTFEHTDGLNYVNIEVNRFDRLNDVLNFKSKTIDVNITEGVGVGMLYPKTNATLFGGERYDEFHVAGYGVSAKVGLNLTFFKYFFLQSDFKVGYITMDDIKISTNDQESASQSFTFFQPNLTFGARFQLIKTDN